MIIKEKGKIYPPVVFSLNYDEPRTCNILLEKKKKKNQQPNYIIPCSKIIFI